MSQMAGNGGVNRTWNRAGPVATDGGKPTLQIWNVRFRAPKPRQSSRRRKEAVIRRAISRN